MSSCAKCQAIVPPTAAFCEACGAKLEESRSAEREASEVEASILLGRAKKACTVLLVVAVLGTLVGLVRVYSAPPEEQMSAAVGHSIRWGLFYLLWWWSRRRPLPAASVGLVLYVLGLVDSLSAGGSMSNRGTMLVTAVIVFFGLAISAGLKHRRFVRSRGLD